MDATTARFASYAAQLAYGDLSARAIHSAKRSLVDAVGCALAAFDAEPVRALRTLASEVSAKRPATLIGMRDTSSPEMTGFVNAVMIRYLDFSDDYFGGSGMQAGPHPSDNIGAVLAATEATGGGGRTLILGMALAYEVCNQLVDYVTLGTRGWDYPIFHSAATALAAGKVLGLDEAHLRHALALAIVPNVCLRETRKGELSMWKGLAGPNGSRSGFFAAQLAQAGITAPASPFEGTAGFMQQLDSRFELGALGGGATPFKIEGTFFKYLPVMYSVQLPILTALELRTKVKIEDIVSMVAYVDAHVSRNDAFSAGRWEPQSRETADHSGPYLMGAALVDGRIDEETMTPRRYRDPAILGLIKKLRVEEDPSYTAARPAVLNCRIVATLASGETVTVHQVNPKGHPANPMNDAEIEEKFLKQIRDVLAPQRARALLDALWKIDEIADVRELFPLMEVAPTAR